MLAKDIPSQNGLKNRPASHGAPIPPLQRKLPRDLPQGLHTNSQAGNRQKQAQRVCSAADPTFDHPSIGAHLSQIEPLKCLEIRGVAPFIVCERVRDKKPTFAGVYRRPALK